MKILRNRRVSLREVEKENPLRFPTRQQDYLREREEKLTRFYFRSATFHAQAGSRLAKQLTTS